MCEWKKEKGFSLIELLISMSITLVLMGLAGQLLVIAFNTRAREQQKSTAVAAITRTINMMTREIANAGFGMTNNGVVNGDADAASIRIRANLNAYLQQPTSSCVCDQDEDLKFLLYTDPATNQNSLIRHDVSTGDVTVLASSINSFEVHYYASKIDFATQGATTAETAPDSARYIVLIATVALPAKGVLGGPGYQPPSQFQVTGDVELRNANLSAY